MNWCETRQKSPFSRFWFQKILSRSDLPSGCCSLDVSPWCHLDIISSQITFVTFLGIKGWHRPSSSAHRGSSVGFAQCKPGNKHLSKVTSMWTSGLVIYSHHNDVLHLLIIISPVVISAGRPVVGIGQRVAVPVSASITWAPSVAVPASLSLLSADNDGI